MIQRTVLPNGVRVISESVPHVQSVSVGVWAACGASDEDVSNRGISHFLEHMFFKGTQTRTAWQIADALDSIGGQINAFTEKEATCYYCRVLSEYLPHALDVLADMVLNSRLESADIQLEKNVVLEEIKRHEDAPDDLVHDLFASTVWNGHPLGNSVLGTKESVEKLTREDLVAFTSSRYTPDNIVVSAAGNLVHEELVVKVASLLGHLEGTRPDRVNLSPCFCNECMLTDKSTEQVQFCIGARGYSQQEQSRFKLVIIDATLGGGMSSRLFQEIREKRGLVYAIGSYSASYRSGGLFMVYGGTSMERLDEVLGLVRDEFAKVVANNITEAELEKAKNQIRAALVLSQESMGSRMIRMAKSDIYHERVVPLEEVLSLVLNVTHDDIAEVAEQVFGDSAFPVAAVGPFNRKDEKCA